MNLKEIEARHEDATNVISWHVAPHLGIAPATVALDAHADRALLLAEVKRLKALCGRAERWMGGNLDTLSSVERKALVAELKEAASE